MNDDIISPKVPYPSRFIEVMGSKMHYWDEGEGDPILFLHGRPMSNYLRRNVMPHMEGQGRLIAPDLIGMGKSDKPDIGYTFEEHYKYLEAFIEKLDLKNITLVVHDRGSGLGFHYANLHRDNIKGIAFMEALIKPMNWDSFPGEYKIIFRLIRAPFIGWLMLSVANMFLKKVVPDSMIRKLSKEEFDHYLAPYPTIASRKAVRVWPQQLPISGKPKRIYDKIVAYNTRLKKSDIPKLCLYAHPGAIIKEEEVAYIQKNFPNTKMVDIGEGIHFVQEDNPHGVGKAISTRIAEMHT